MMKQRNVILIIMLMLIVITTGCRTTSSDDNNMPNYKLMGKVTDISDNPLTDVKLFVEYSIQTDPAKPLTPISFNLPESGQLLLWITPFFSSDTVSVLMDGFCESGNHSYHWNGKNSEGITVPDNFYYYHIKTHNDYFKKPLFIYGSLPDYTNYNSYQELASTNSDGNYAININELAFSCNDNTLMLYDMDGNVEGTCLVTRTITLWAIDGEHERKGILIENIPLNNTNNIVNDIILLNRN